MDEESKAILQKMITNLENFRDKQEGLVRKYSLDELRSKIPGYVQRGVYSNYQLEVMLRNKAIIRDFLREVETLHKYPSTSTEDSE